MKVYIVMKNDAWGNEQTILHIFLKKEIAEEYIDLNFEKTSYRKDSTVYVDDWGDIITIEEHDLIEDLGQLED